MHETREIKVPISQADDTCPECHGGIVETETALTCGKCGLQIGKILIQQYRIDVYDSQDRHHDYGKRSFHDPLLSIELNEAPHLSKVASHPHLAPVERNRVWLLTELRQVGRILDLPQPILTRGSWLMFKTLRAWLMRKTLRVNSMIIMAACLYLACKESNIAIRIEKFIQIFTDRRHRMNQHLLLQSAQRIAILHGLHGVLRSPPDLHIVRVVHDVARACSCRDVARLERRSRDLARQFPSKQHYDPRALAAGAVYRACHELGMGVSQDTISIIAGTTAVSLRKYAKVFRRIG